MDYEENWEIETRFRILNPRREKDEIFLVFPANKVVKRYTSKNVDLYLQTGIEDPNYFLRLRKAEVFFSDGKKTRLCFLNEKRMLDRKYPQTEMGVRVAFERDFKSLSKNYSTRKIVVKVSGSRKAYEIEGFEVTRDSIDNLGEFIECGAVCEEEKDVEIFRERVNAFARELFEKLNDTGLKVEVEPKIYPELLTRLYKPFSR